MIPGEKTLLSGLGVEEREREYRDAMDVSEEELAKVLSESAGDFGSSKVIEGTVVGVLDDDVVVDIGYKSEGFVPKSDFDGSEELKPGMKAEVLIDSFDDETGLLVLSKRKADRIRGWENIISNHRVGDLVTGRAIRKIKGGLLVDIGVPVFLPASQVDVRRVGDVGEYIGREMTCKIIKIDPERRNIVLSRREVIEEERAEMKMKLLSEIERGEVRRGIVKNLTDFGAFVDLGGIDGLLHVTDISWGRISHPSEVLSPGQVVDVKILDFNLERERISLGFKQLTPNPWTNVRERYPISSRVRGEVVNVMPYGAFVKLEEGVEGLVHVSEMTWGRQVSHAADVVNVGDIVEVVVLEIDEGKQEVSLGMKQAEGNPWADVEKKYPPGTRIKGNVRNLTNYGAFVEIEEGLDGLLHVSDMSWTKKINHPSSVLKKGQEVEAIVLSVDPERSRIALGLKQLVEDPWEKRIPEKFHRGDVVKGVVTKLTSFGAFVQVDEDVEGLLHISEMSDKKIDRPEDVVAQGQEIELRVINVDPVERKIGLSVKAVEFPPQEIAEEAEIRKYAGPAAPSGRTLSDSVGGEILKQVLRSGKAAEEEQEKPAEEPAAGGAAEEQKSEAPGDKPETAASDSQVSEPSPDNVVPEATAIEETGEAPETPDNQETEKAEKEDAGEPGEAAAAAEDSQEKAPAEEVAQENKDQVSETAAPPSEEQGEEHAESEEAAPQGQPEEADETGASPADSVEDTAGSDEEKKPPENTDEA